MESRQSGNATWLALTFLCGAALGATAAILYAPRSGRETRDKLKELAASARARLLRVDGESEDVTRAA